MPHTQNFRHSLGVRRTPTAAPPSAANRTAAPFGAFVSSCPSWLKKLRSPPFLRSSCKTVPFITSGSDSNPRKGPGSQAEEQRADDGQNQCVGREPDRGNADQRTAKRSE